MSSGLYIPADRGVMDSVYDYTFHLVGGERPSTSGCIGAEAYGGNDFYATGTLTLGRHELGNFAHIDANFDNFHDLCKPCAMLIFGMNLSTASSEERYRFMESGEIAQNWRHRLRDMSYDELLALPAEQRTYPVDLSGEFSGTPYCAHFTADLRVDFPGDYMTQLHLLNVVLEFTLV